MALLLRAPFLVVVVGARRATAALLRLPGLTEFRPERGNHPGRSIVYPYMTEHLPRRHRIVLAIVLALSALIAGTWALVG